MLVVQSNSLDEIQALAEKKEELLAAIPTIQPIKQEDLKRMASGYGWRTDPFTKKTQKTLRNGLFSQERHPRLCNWRRDR